MTAVLKAAARALRCGGRDAERLAAAMAPVRASGLCDLALATRWGGGGASMSSVVENVRLASRLDGSLGFLLSQSALGHLITAGFSDAVLGELHRAGPAAIAGVFAPKGRAKRDSEGWLVSGRWPLATGAVLADHVYLQCFAMECRQFIVGPSGSPVPILAIIPAASISVERTWNASGLQATASDTIVAVRVRVPEARMGTLLSVESKDVGGVPVRPFKSAHMAGLTIAAVAVGLAEGLLDAVAGLGQTGRRAAFEHGPMADAPASRRDLGMAAMLVEASAALLDRAASGQFGFGMPGRARTQATPATVVQLCVDAAAELQSLAGSEAIDHGGEICRKLEDLRTLSLHAWANKHRMEPLGSVLMGGQVDPVLLPPDHSGGDEGDGMAMGENPAPAERPDAGRIGK
jgi:alkylation response protein AidB-like acyl-CoA dehydrogenase